MVPSFLSERVAGEKCVHVGETRNITLFVVLYANTYLVSTTFGEARKKLGSLLSESF